MADQTSMLIVERPARAQTMARAGFLGPHSAEVPTRHGVLLDRPHPPLLATCARNMPAHAEPPVVERLLPEPG